jgi:molecular chaperone GrpE
MQPDMVDNDDIEILEVVALDEDSPGAGARKDDPEEGRDEVTLDFDDPAGGTPAPRSDGGREEGPASEHDRLLRLQADFENFKKRMEREQEANERHAAAGLVTRLLPVLDNFERALSSEVPTAEGRAFQDGVALIFRQLLDELRKQGLAAVDSIGQEFDPNVHEAVAMDRDSGLPPNTVVEELRRGYLLHQRLLRAAQVKVSLDPEGPHGPDATGGEE